MAMDIVTILFGAILGSAISLAFFYLQRGRQKQELAVQEERLQQKLEAVDEKSAVMKREMEISSKAHQLRIEEELQKKFQKKGQELDQLKARFDKREEQLDRKFDQLDIREREIDKRRSKLDSDRTVLDDQKEKYKTLLTQADKKLEEIAGMSSERARELIMSSLAEKARRESAGLFKQLETEAIESAEQKARDTIATAVQRLAGEFVSERTVSVVALPSEEMKGRIIGREGRNIRAIETATGCDLIIDDTPEAVVISCFNPVRRQIAKRSLEELITDGRIHPARIESVVKKATKTIDNEIREKGEQAVFEVGLSDVHPEIIKLLGTLQFRTSYTQNVLSHSVEVAYFAGIMAEELGLDGNLARRCGLLHDIGKAVDHEIQGSHAVIGGELAKKYREHPLVVNAIWSHHFDIEPISVYGPLANASDALSAARPGARRENVETYVKRLEQLEGIATEFKGVDKAFAIQAGREVRVIVSYDRVNDEGAMMIAREVADRIENEMTYPGQIKVTVIREMRAQEIAN
ncbi:MAG: ribonuclease Y [Magnetococcales bacterium]|nr:ribonuclease Y [Magnetococcales bacterium]